MQLRPMCNQHIIELMTQIRSAHAPAIELKNQIFVGQHKKDCSKKVHGTSKDNLDQLQNPWHMEPNLFSKQNECCYYLKLPGPVKAASGATWAALIS